MWCHTVWIAANHPNSHLGPALGQTVVLGHEAPYREAPSAIRHAGRNGTSGGGSTLALVDELRSRRCHWSVTSHGSRRNVSRTYGPLYRRLAHLTPHAQRPANVVVGRAVWLTVDPPVGSHDRITLHVLLKQRVGRHVAVVREERRARRRCGSGATRLTLTLVSIVHGDEDRAVRREGCGRRPGRRWLIALLSH